jgi:hypothetical protein
MGLVILGSFSNRLAERPTSCELFHKQFPTRLSHKRFDKKNGELLPVRRFEFVRRIKFPWP